jgi:hypothetical protein
MGRAGFPSRGGAGSRAAAPRSASSARDSRGRPQRSRSPRGHCIARIARRRSAETRSVPQMKTIQRPANHSQISSRASKYPVGVVRRIFRGRPIPSRDRIGGSVRQVRRASCLRPWEESNLRAQIRSRGRASRLISAGLEACAATRTTGTSKGRQGSIPRAVLCTLREAAYEEPRQGETGRWRH